MLFGDVVVDGGGGGGGGGGVGGVGGGIVEGHGPDTTLLSLGLLADIHSWITYCMSAYELSSNKRNLTDISTMACCRNNHTQ